MWDLRLGISSLNSCQTSDPRAHESKIQDFEKLVLENLGSNNPIWILDFCPGSKKVFDNLGSWILGPDPRKVFWSSWMHCNKTSIKPQKTKTFFLDNVFVWSSCFVFWFYSCFCDLRTSSLKRVQTWKSQVWHCKDPTSKIQDVQNTFLDPGQKSWIRIQDPRCKIVKKFFGDPGQKVAAVGSARYCIILNLVVHHPVGVYVLLMFSWF